ALVRAVSRARLAHTAGYALALVALTNAISLLDRNILAILAPRIKHDLGIGDAEMGLLYGTVFALFYALFSLPLGRLADGWVRTRLLAITLGFWSLATALAAAANGFALLALSRPGVGIGGGAATPPDAHPFRASLALLAAVTPGLNWLAFAGRRAGVRDWGVNLVATILAIAAATVLTRITSAFSPRPLLHFGPLAVNPHALQWGVVGFGALVVVNLLQRLRLADRPTFEVITRSPALLLCMGVGALQMMINYGTIGFTPSFLMKHYGLSPATTGLEFGV